MKNIAKTAHHHEETPHDNAPPNVKKGERLGCCLSPMAKIYPQFVYIFRSIPVHSTARHILT